MSRTFSTDYEVHSHDTFYTPVRGPLRGGGDTLSVVPGKGWSVTRFLRLRGVVGSPGPFLFSVNRFLRRRVVRDGGKRIILWMRS